MDIHPIMNIVKLLWKNLVRAQKYTSCKRLGILTRIGVLCDGATIEIPLWDFLRLPFWSVVICGLDFTRCILLETSEGWMGVRKGGYTYRMSRVESAENFCRWISTDNTVAKKKVCRKKSESSPTIARMQNSWTTGINWKNKQQSSMYINISDVLNLPWKIQSLRW